MSESRRWSFGKWLAFGFLGTIGVFLTFVLILSYKFSPLLRVDSKNDRVVILGGLIDVDGVKNTVNVAGLQFRDRDEDGVQVTGSVNLMNTTVKLVKIPFSNGKVEITTSARNELSWSCKVHGVQGGAAHSLEGTTLTLNLFEYSGAECEIILPEKITARIDGQNGTVALMRPRANINVDLMNGEVSVTPDPTQLYHYGIRVMNGRVDRFESSLSTRSHHLNISVMNGRVDRETAGI